jgi:ABC-type transport system substrate-binding protein
LVGETPMTAPVLSRFGAGALWSVSYQGGLTRIDLRTHETTSIGLRIASPCGLAVGGGAVWVTDCSTPTLVRVDPALSPPVPEEFPLPSSDVAPPNATGEVAFGAGSVWVAHGQQNPGSFVERLDPASGRQQAHVPILGGAQALSFGGGAVWVVGSAPGYVSKIDPATNRIVARAQNQPLHGFMCCVAAGGGYVWVATSPDDTVWKLSASGKVLSSTRLRSRVQNLAYGDGGVWATAGGVVARIDATTDAPRTYAVGHGVFGVAERGGLFAVGVQATDSERGDSAVAGLTGNIARVALDEGWLDRTDPTFTPSWNYALTQLQYATCAKLLNYPDVSGAGGTRLVPEVAAAWPTVTNGGRTYAFRIRDDYRFAPTNESVTPASFRRAIERALSPSIAASGNTAYTLVSDVVGATAYRAGRARRITGLSIRSDTLVIRLVKPVPELPRRLASPFFCAVPAHTPIPPDGVSSPIPSAGPYYIAAHAGNAVVLKPNPYYQGPRARRLDAIIYRSGIKVGTAVAMVARGTFDVVSAFDPSLNPETDAGRAAGARLRLVSTNQAIGLAFNTTRPPFSNIRIRRAVEYALDRRVLAGTYDAPATALLTENLPGRDAVRYPLTKEPSTARRLLAGKRPHIVFSPFDLSDPGTAAFSKAVRRELTAIGMSVTVVPRKYDDPQWNAKLAQADLAMWNMPSDSGDAVSYLMSLPYLPPALQRRLNRIATRPYPRRDVAAAAVAAKLEREALYAVVGHGAIPELHSRRLGCLVHNPEYPGLDLAALCIRGE